MGTIISRPYTDPLVEILCDPNGLIQVRKLRLLPNGIL